MISLQQQQKPADLLLWPEREQQRSPPAPASVSNSSLNCALENSMKVWQVIFFFAFGQLQCLAWSLHYFYCSQLIVVL